MMMKHITVTFFSLFFTTLLDAQKSEQGFDINFKPAASGWRYYAVTEKKDDLWYREAYYLPEKSMAMTGSYKDKDCKIAEGKTIWYYPNKNPKSSISYKDGKEEGTALRFHENGMIRDSVNYTNGHRIGISLGWDEEGNQLDSSNFDGNGNGVVVGWHKDGSVSYAGRITNDTTRISRWVYYHLNGKQLAVQDYVNGKVVHCSCSDEMGNQLDSSLCVEKEAQFPGEEKGWRKFLEKNLNPDIPVKNRAPEGTYQVIVQFIVDKEGQITDIKPLTRFGFGMEEEVIRILKNSPRWTPAFQFGRNVKAYRRQPITFVVSRS
ncbi:MAG TPA: energy transducer TonB [Chitinophagaceae bacterium]|nr:energy transducer TonB [Chitinophagaceae bacterium]